MKRLLLSLVTVLPFMGFAAEKTIVQDDFSNPKRYGQAWVRTDGSWKYDSGSKTLRQSIGAPHRVGKLYLKRELPDNFEISFDLTYLGGKSMKGFGGGVILKHPGVNKEGVSYQMGIATHGQSGLRLFKITTVLEKGKLKNKYKQLALFDSIVMEQNKKASFKVRVSGNTFTCWVDGEEMFEYEDKDPVKATGKFFGFSTYGVAADYDNLVIKEIGK